MSDPAVNLNMPVVHTIRRDFTYADKGKQLTIGVIPKGSVIIKAMSGVNVHTAFNDSGTDLLDIGTSADDDLYATDLAISAVGFIPCDEAVSFYVAADTIMTCTYTGQNADPTAGAAQAFICFIPPDPAQK